MLLSSSSPTPTSNPAAPAAPHCAVLLSSPPLLLCRLSVRLQAVSARCRPSVRLPVESVCRSQYSAGCQCSPSVQSASAVCQCSPSVQAGSASCQCSLSVQAVSAVCQCSLSKAHRMLAVISHNREVFGSLRFGAASQEELRAGFGGPESAAARACAWCLRVVPAPTASV